MKGLNRLHVAIRSETPLVDATTADIETYALLTALGQLRRLKMRAVVFNGDGDAELQAADGASTVVSDINIPSVVVMPIESALCD